MIKEQRQGDQDPYHIIPHITLQHTNYTKGLTHNVDLKMTVLLRLKNIYIPFHCVPNAGTAATASLLTSYFPLTSLNHC